MARLKERSKTAKGRKVITGYCAVFYDPDRYPREKSITLRTRNAQTARIRLANIERLFALEVFDPWKDRAPIEGVSLSSAIDRFLMERETTRRPKTVRSDEIALRTFCKDVPAGANIRHIEARHIRAFMDKHKAKGTSSATRHSYFTRIRFFFGWAVKEGYVKHNPTNGIEKPRLLRKAKATLTREQYEKLRRTITDEAAANISTLKDGELVWLVDVVDIAVQTGMRLGEICAMRWSWIDLSKGEITVRRSSDFQPKSGHERVIPITPHVRSILSSHAKGGGTQPDEFVFQSRRGRVRDADHLAPEYVSRRFRHLRIKAGLPSSIRFHSLRHTFCTWLIQSGTPVPVVQRLAGHADIKTTMDYIHVANRDLHEGMQRTFDSSFAPVRMW